MELIGNEDTFREWRRRHSNCVIFFRGNVRSAIIAGNEGNRRYQELIEQNCERYDNARDNAEKTAISTSILHRLRYGNPNEGILPHEFVQKEGRGNDAVYYIISMSEKAIENVRRKVAESLRAKIRNLRNRNNEVEENIMPRNENQEGFNYPYFEEIEHLHDEPLHGEALVALMNELNDVDPEIDRILDAMIE